MLIRLTFLFLMSITPLLSNEKMGTVNLQLRWHHQFQFAGYYAAVEKGFYKDEGLDVNIIAGDPKHISIDEVVTKKAQYGVGNSELLVHRLHGDPLIAMAVVFQHSASVLLVKKESGIKTPHDLIGKNLMLLTRDADPEFLTMFKNEGIPPELINIIPSSFDLNDLISGKTDAFNAYITNEPFYLQEQNIPYSVVYPSSYGVDFYSDILFTSEDELKYHANRVEAMKRASLRGWKYAMEHPDEIIDLLITKYKVPKSREHLKYEANEMKKLILPDLIEIGRINPERFNYMAGTLIASGIVSSKSGLDGFIYDPKPTQLPIKLVISIIALFGLVISLILLWNTVLRRKIKQAIIENQEISEKFFKQTKKAEIGAMVANISHQWRGPLSKLGAINLLNMVKLNNGQKLDDDILLKRCLETDKIIEFMSKTMTSFLEFYKENDRVELFDVAESIENILSIIETKTLDAHTKIEILKNENIKIFGIKHEWMNVWLNLLSNAIEALKANKIDNPKIVITIEQNSVKICDNAGGMDLNISNSTGLGLKMCREIADKYATKLLLHNNEEGLCVQIKFGDSIIV